MSHSKDYHFWRCSEWTELSLDDKWYTQITHITALPHHPLEFPSLPAPLQVVASACKYSILSMLLNDTNGEILILPQYPEIIKHIARIYRKRHTMGTPGVLIDGQPGIVMCRLGLRAVGLSEPALVEPGMAGAVSRAEGLGPGSDF
ncbi:hypothetical protein BDP27DRAFT_1366161 [Rhodocollybia butyracea]|uniref:Uncharacterized protein n=1 Tax=Rhodocollybia butyracea TaxID=206335 RepID=A0A9P5PHH5_9AGAR|nr:hypothetical protein BDP27DRAFT_1366161 [Rhodocollybia butyracea]